MLSLENKQFVQKKFNDFTKYGYKKNLWRNYKSFLRYGFEVDVNQLHVKEHLKQMITKFVTVSLPQEIKDRAVYLYAFLKKYYNLSDLPLTIIFQFNGIFNHYEYARERMEIKRKMFKAQQQRYEERKRRKRDVKLNSCGETSDKKPTISSIDKQNEFGANISKEIVERKDSSSDIAELIENTLGLGTDM